LPALTEMAIDPPFAVALDLVSPAIENVFKALAKG
jgi:hypothetical protein